MIELTQPSAGEADQPPKCRSIVVATEGWLDNDPAVDHAIRLARTEDITIHLVATARTPLPIATTEVRRVHYDRLVERAVTVKMAELASMIERFRRLSIDARAHVRLGDLAIVVREIAHGVQADMILIACPAPTRRHPRRAQRGLATLLATTSVPVLVVPAPSPRRSRDGSDH